jgi:hypothetical protein
VSSTRLTTSSTSDRHRDVADHAERPLVAKLYQLTGPLSSPTIDERRVSSPHDEKTAFYPPVSASKNSVPNSDIRDRFNDWVGVGSAIGIERVTPEQYHATIAASSSAYSTGCCQCNCDALGRARQRWTGIGHSSDVAAGTASWPQLSGVPRNRRRPRRTCSVFRRSQGFCPLSGREVCVSLLPRVNGLPARLARRLLRKPTRRIHPIYYQPVALAGAILANIVGTRF